LWLTIDPFGEDPNLGAVGKFLAYLHLPRAPAILGWFQHDWH
jgi:hypothetical protein